MSNVGATTWYHSNHYHAQSACEHCEGIIRHEPWCITLDPAVYYAYQIVADPNALTLGDSLILHSLGVTWIGKKCPGKCGAGRAAPLPA
jgi:hypothetical protein